MVESVHSHFPALFDPQDEEGREDRPDADGETGERGGQSVQPYGITPYVLTYCRVANTPIAEAYKSSVIHLFYIVTYETERLRRENERLKQYMRKGHSGM